VRSPPHQRSEVSVDFGGARAEGKQDTIFSQYAEKETNNKNKTEN
jgi:hypothetical protein